MSIKSKYIEYICNLYAGIDESSASKMISDNLFSPFKIQVKKKIIENIRSEIAQYWKLRSWGDTYKNHLYKKLNLLKPENYSVCMSYDFHLNKDDQLELIEINTNAGFMHLGLDLYNLLNLKNGAIFISKEEYLKSFLNEINLKKSEITGRNIKIVIVDDSPVDQKLYIEFLTCSAFFKNNNIDVEIIGIDQISTFGDADLIYNRYNDFCFESEQASQMKELFNSGAIPFTPQPYEYFLLSDKQRLVDWYNQSEIEHPKSLLPIYDLQNEPKEKIWDNRKSLFFKPKRSYGSKQSYRGATISRLQLDKFYESEFVAQKISPPPEMSFEYNGEQLRFKYDLRCYVYKDELQMVVARLYRGQATNLQTFAGGYACVEVIV